jgi:glycosyltransferase involved in cell wall biosynthesis
MRDNYSRILISIIIRNKNEAGFFELAQSIKIQQFVNTEMIVVSNESDDNSVEIARRYNCRILNLPKDLFTYRKVLN